MLDSPIDLHAAIKRLQTGHVVAIPTETVYGLAASIAHLGAIEQIFQIKGRPNFHPLIIHLADPDELKLYAVDIPAYVPDLIRAFCPGPLTFVLKRSARVPLSVTGGQDTVGIRFPAHPLTQAIIEGAGFPLAAPSANRFGRISPTTAAHVIQEFDGLVPVLDGGACEVGIESTIIDATHSEQCAILRQGSISADAIRAHLPSSVMLHEQAQRRIRVSGALKKHYAPRKPTFLFSSRTELEALNEKWGSLSILCHSETPWGSLGECQAISSQPHDYAKRLYSELRALDETSTTLAIAIENPPTTPEWVAIWDRLTRATSQ